MMDPRDEFELYQRLLSVVVMARGGDGGAAANTYAWPADMPTPPPRSMVAMSSMLGSDTAPETLTAPALTPSPKP